MKFTVGVLGAGSISLDTHLPVLLNRRDVCVAWVADISKRAVQRARDRYALPTHHINADNIGILPETEAVLVAIPVGSRDPYHRQLERRQSRIYLEKPFARTESEACSLISAYRNHRMICGFQRREHPGVRTLRRLIASREFGEVKRVIVREGVQTRATGMAMDFRNDAALAGGGILADLGSHGIDLAFYLTGCTSAEILHQKMLFDGDIDRDVRLTCLLSGGRTVELVIELSWIRELGREFSVEFESAVARTGPRPNDSVVVTPNGGSSRNAFEISPKSSDPSTVWAAVAEVWSRILPPARTGSAILPDPATYLPTVKLVEESYGRARS
jgi:predicted dehydrogenase